MINLPNEEARQRVRAESERTEAALALKYMRSIRAIMNRQSIRVANNYRMNGVFLEDLVDKDKLRMKDVSLRHVRSASIVFRDKVFESFDEFNQRQETPEETEHQRIMEAFFGIWLTTKLLQRTRSTKKVIARIINAGIRNGLSQNEIAAKIISTGRISNAVRAARIARTEVHTVAMKSKNESAIVKAVFSRKTINKHWVSTLDSLTRDGHISANGEIVPIKDDFLFTGEPLQYPGDPKGSPGNIINCRCDAVYEVVA